jgi:hypothetical protein
MDVSWARTRLGCRLAQPVRGSWRVREGGSEGGRERKGGKERDSAKLAGALELRRRAHWRAATCFEWQGHGSDV